MYHHYKRVAFHLKIHKHIVHTDIVGEIDVRYKNFFTVPIESGINAVLRADVAPGYDDPISHELRIYTYFRG